MACASSIGMELLAIPKKSYEFHMISEVKMSRSKVIANSNGCPFRNFLITYGKLFQFLSQLKSF